MHALLLAAGLCAVAAPGLAFGPGEELVYDLSFFGAEAGTVRVDVGAAMELRGKAVWPIVVISRSAGAVDAVYPVRDRFVTYWDFAARQGVQAMLVAHEKGKSRRLSIAFERGGADGGAATVAQVEIEDEHGLERFRRELPPGAEDLGSAIYWLRTRPLRVGDREELPIFTGKHEWTLVATVLGKETIEGKLGKVPAIHVRLATVLSGKLAGRRDLDGWFSDDPRHVPLRLDADLLLGTVRADLVRVEPGRVESPGHD